MIKPKLAALAFVTSAAVAAPAFACPNMDHDQAPQTADKAKKDAPAAAPKAKDDKPATDTAAKAKRTDSKAAPKDAGAKKPDKVSSR